MGIICPAIGCGIFATYGTSMLAGGALLISALVNLCMPRPERSRACCSVGCELVVSVINASFCVFPIGLSIWVIARTAPDLDDGYDGGELTRALFATAVVGLVFSVVLIILSLLLIVELRKVRAIFACLPPSIALQEPYPGQATDAKPPQSTHDFVALAPVRMGC